MTEKPCCVIVRVILTSKDREAEAPYESVTDVRELSIKIKKK